MKAKKVVISGYYGFGNSGDEAILSTITRDLKELQSDIDMTVLSIKPQITQKQHGVKAINRYNLFELVKCIKNCDMLISGGGTLLQDHTSTRSLLYYLYIIRIALFFKKKVMLYGNGIGPIHQAINRKRVKDIIDKVAVITLRDKESYKLLKEIDIIKPDIIVTADPVMTYGFSDEDRIDKIFKEENIPINDKLIGINMREWYDTEKLEDEMVYSIEYIYKKYSLIPVFISMSPSDREIARRLCERLQNKVYILSKDYEPEDLIGIIGRMKLVIAMRLHTLIYASINSVPMLGIAYDPKVNGCMDYIKQASIRDVGKVSSMYINNEIDNILLSYEQKREQLKQIVSELKVKSKENAQIAIDLLNRKE